jgi:predicted lipid-binding transport protein (Tim44 family)
VVTADSHQSQPQAQQAKRPAEACPRRSAEGDAQRASAQQAKAQQGAFAAALGGVAELLLGALRSGTLAGDGSGGGVAPKPSSASFALLLAASSSSRFFASASWSARRCFHAGTLIA